VILSLTLNKNTLKPLQLQGLELTTKNKIKASKVNCGIENYFKIEHIELNI
jgi:hypothetical protein